MKHLGDISKIDWFSVEPVDVVTVSDSKLRAFVKSCGFEVNKQL